MRLKILFFLCFLFSVSAFSQIKNVRFIYEYKYAMDTTKIDSMYSELMYLDILNDESYFYSRDVAIGDSLVKKALSGLSSQGGSISVKNKGRVRDIIKKNIQTLLLQQQQMWG